MANGIDYTAPMNAFISGQESATKQQNALLSQDKAKNEQAMQAIELIGSAALGAKGGNLKAPADPAKFEQGLDFLASRGLDVSKFRGRPETADVAADAAVGALNQIKLGQSASQAMMQMQLQLMQLQQGTQNMQMQAKQFERQSANDAFNQQTERRKIALQETSLNRKEVPAGFRAAPDGGLQPIPGGPEDPAYKRSISEATGKDVRRMSAGDVAKLTDEGGKMQAVNRFSETFNDSYAGYGGQMIGNAAMTAGRYLPSSIAPGKTEEASRWWQDYDRYKNQIRNDLFGSALTANEQAAFERADINPGMSPKQIRENLTRQSEAMKSAAKRKAQALSSEGYSTDTVASAYGLKPSDLGVSGKPSAPAAPSQAAPAAGKPDVKARIEQLKGGGMDAAAIKAKLKEEGYW